MESAIFDYRDYKKFIKDSIEGTPEGGRGVRRKLANHLRVQGPFISQVLAGSLHFSPEQAAGCAEYFGLDQRETDFLINLVLLQKSGTNTLKVHLQKKIDEMVTQHQQIQKRIKIEKSLDPETQAFYYSSWHYCAIHMAITIPELRTRQAISENLGLPLQKVDEVLAFLVKVGLVSKEGSFFTATGQWLHIKADSPLISKHHTNVRLRALQSLDHPKPQDLHYSAYFTCSKKDLPKVREILLKAMSEFNECVRPSKEELLVGLGLDLFMAS